MIKQMSAINVKPFEQICENKPSRNSKTNNSQPTTMVVK